MPSQENGYSWDLVLVLPRHSFQHAPPNGLSGHDIIQILQLTGFETYVPWLVGLQCCSPTPPRHPAPNNPTEPHRYTYKGYLRDSYMCKLRVKKKALGAYADGQNYMLPLSAEVLEDLAQAGDEVGRCDGVSG